MQYVSIVRLFYFMMSFPAISFGDRHAMSGLSSTKRAWLSQEVGGGGISVLFGISGLSNELSYLIGLLFPVFKSRFQLYQDRTFKTLDWEFIEDR